MTTPGPSVSGQPTPKIVASEYDPEHNPPPVGEGAALIAATEQQIADALPADDATAAAESAAHAWQQTARILARALDGSPAAPVQPEERSNGYRWMRNLRDGLAQRGVPSTQWADVVPNAFALIDGQRAEAKALHDDLHARDVAYDERATAGSNAVAEIDRLRRVNDEWGLTMSTLIDGLAERGVPVKLGHRYTQAALDEISRLRAALATAERERDEARREAAQQLVATRAVDDLRMAEIGDLTRTLDALRAAFVTLANQYDHPETRAVAHAIRAHLGLPIYAKTDTAAALGSTPTEEATDAA